MNIREPRWLTCQIEGEGGDAGGGGGSGPVSSPSGGPSEPSGSSFNQSQAPNPQSDAQPMAYSPSRSDRDPTDNEVTEVKRILDKGRDPAHTLSMDEIQSLLGMPMKFKPNAEPAVAPVPEPAAAQADPNADPNADPATQAPAPALSPEVRALVDALKEVVGPKTEAPTATKADQTQTPAAPKKFYGEIAPAVEIAPQLADAIFNADNPEQARAGLNFLINGVMNRLMDDSRAQILNVAKTMLTQFPQIASQQVEAKSFGEKFYGKFPELNRDAIKPIVGQLAGAMAKEFQRAGRPVGDEAFNSALAEAAHKFLEAQLGRSFRPDQKIAQPVTPAPKKTPWIAPASSSRPAAPAKNGKDDWTSLVI